MRMSARMRILTHLRHDSHIISKLEICEDHPAQCEVKIAMMNVMIQCAA